MARRFHILSVLSSIVFLLAFSVKTAVFAASPIPTWAQLLNEQLATVPDLGEDEDLPQFEVMVLDGVDLDNVSMFSVDGADFTLSVIKRGLGNWRLGDENPYLDPIPPDDGSPPQMIYGTRNVLNTGGSANTFVVEAGILDLMRGTTLQLSGGGGSAFTIGPGAHLNARGSNLITLAGMDMTLDHTSTLGFDLTDRRTGYGEGTALLTIDGDIVVNRDDPADRLNINILGFANIETAAGITATLLSYNYEPPAADDAEPVNPPIHASNVNLQVRGQDWAAVTATGRLSGQLAQGPTADGVTTLLLTGLRSPIGTVRWTGTASNLWNATASNWEGNIGGGPVTTFLHGDSVIFDSVPTRQDILVQAGGVQIGGAPQAGSMTVSGGSYTFRNAADSTIGIDGPGSVIVTGQWTEVDFYHANSYWGGTSIENGVLTARHAKALGTGHVQINTPGTLIFNVDDDGSEYGPFVWNEIRGQARSTLIKQGEGRLNLNGSLGGFRGDTVIEEGTLYNGIGTGLLTVYQDATYNARNNATGLDTSRTIAGLSDWPRWDLNNPEPNGGSVEMGEGRLTISVAGSSEHYTFSGTISGSAVYDEYDNLRPTLIKDGAGAQILTGDSQDLYGGTNIRLGSLVIQRTLEMDLPIYPLGVASATNAVNVSQNGVLQFDIAGSDFPDVVATFENAIHGSGTVRKMAYPGTVSPRENSAVLNLTSADSTYTGLTDVREGILRVGHVNATGKTNEVRLAADTTLQFNTGPLPTGHLVENHTYDRIITGAGDVEVLTGTAIYVSGMNHEQPDVTSSYTGTTTVQTNATLRLLNAEATGKTSMVNLVASTSNLYLDFEHDQTYDRYITGSGNLWKTGIGTATLDYSFVINPITGQRVPVKVDNDYTGLTTVENGILKLMYAQATGADDPPGIQRVIVNGSGILELAFDGEYNKGITGTGAIAKSNEDTVTTLNGRNNYTGGTYIWGGTLAFTNTDTINGSGNLGLGNVRFQKGGGTLRNTEENLNFDRNIEIEGGSTATFDTWADMIILSSATISHPGEDPPPESHLTKTGEANLTIEALAAWTGDTIVEKGWLIGNIPTDTRLTVTAPGGYRTEDSNRQVSFLGGDGTVETFVGRDFIVNNSEENDFGGTITGGGNLVKIGKGLFILSGNNNYAGQTVVKQGTLRGNIADRTALKVDGDATYDSGGQKRTICSLDGEGIVDMRGGLLEIDMSRIAATTQAKFDGQIRNGSRLVKSGEATQILAGQLYNFSGDVIVSGGTLGVGSTFPSATDFRVGGNLDVKQNGTFAINPYAAVTVGQTLNVDGTFDVAIGSNIVTATDVTLGDGSTINITGITSSLTEITSETKTQTIIRSTNDIEGTFTYETVAGAPKLEVDYLSFGVFYEPKAVKVGQTLRWYSGVGDEDPDNGAHGTFTIANRDGSFNVGVPLVDITEPTKKLSSWDGKTLTKEGPGTLILSTRNEYTGETLVNEGILKLTHAEATAGSSLIKLGNIGILELDFDGSMKTPITGTGTDVYKTGNSVSVLTGISTYSADTTVKQGSLYIDGSLLATEVWVDAGAGFGGNGKVNNTVNFRNGSFFDWRFGKTEEESDMLTVGGINIVGDVWVRPNTNIPTLGALTNIDGWKILRYSGELDPKFAGVENKENPYYDFELDYSLAGYVRINGFLRNEPRALSDIVATSLVMAQSKMYRSAYQQIAREWASDCPDHPVTGYRINGQTHRPYRTAWMNFIGRGEQYASRFFDENYLLQSYGVQVGISLFSDCRNSFGLMYGREESKLGNSSDTVRGEDNQLGLYYGRAFVTDLDFRGYIGGGWQKNRLIRNSNGNTYHANYGGNTFHIDAEFGRRFLTERLWTLRPFIGLDLAHAGIGRSTETCSSDPNSNEYRSYDRATLTQFLSRIGFEIGKGWRRFDFNSGLHLAWNWADTDPTVRIYYPATGGTVMSRASDIGRFALVMNVGANWYITPQRNTMFYLNYVGDINLDRHGTGGNTGYVGFLWKF